MYRSVHVLWIRVHAGTLLPSHETRLVDIAHNTTTGNGRNLSPELNQVYCFLPFTPFRVWQIKLWGRSANSEVL